ncbi:MAG: hypothetical protein WBK88_07045 [Methanothrix sp.]
MRRELIAIIVTAALLTGAAASQSSWYPRSADYVTAGDFIGDGMNLSGDAVIQGDLAVEGDMTVAGDFAAEGNVSFEWGPSPDPDFGMFVWGFLDVWGPAGFWDDVYFMEDITVDGDIVNTALDERIGAIEDDVGDVTNMTTTATDLAAAVDELDGEMGDLATLTTTETGSIVGAVNEVDGLVEGIDTRVGDLESDVGDVANMTTTATDLAGAIDELDAEIGDLTSLNTTETGSLVGAINELDSDVTTLTERTGELATNDTEQQAAIDALESPPVWHVQTITTPAAATSDEVLDGTDGAITTDGTNIDAASMTGTIDAARCLILTPGDAMTGDALLTGTNVNNEAITETINWGANATATTTTQAFKTIAWANFTTDTNTSVTIDYSDKLGLDVIPDDADAVMFTFLGGVMETTLPTVTIGATVAECSADLDSALTGADVKIYVYEAV